MLAAEKIHQYYSIVFEKNGTAILSYCEEMDPSHYSSPLSTLGTPSFSIYISNENRIQFFPSFYVSRHENIVAISHSWYITVVPFCAAIEKIYRKMHKTLFDHFVCCLFNIIHNQID